jgi:hypothetical protein
MTLPADVARCAGVGDEDGWREGCGDCLRRTSPPIDHQRVAHMEPPPIITFFCEYHMPPNHCPSTGDLF